MIRNGTHNGKKLLLPFVCEQSQDNVIMIPKGTPRLIEVLNKLIIPTDTIHTRNTRYKHQVYRKIEKKSIGKRQLTITQNI